MKNCYWQPTPIEPNRKKPDHEHYDALIIGGGFAGLSSARFLKEAQPSLKVAVLEKDYVGFGASGRNGGFAMTLLGLNHSQLLRDAGLETARAAHAWAKKAVDYVRKTVIDKNIDCEMVDKGFMGIGLNSIHVKKLRHEVEVLQKLGTTEAKFLDRGEMARILPDSMDQVEGGLWEPHCVVLHPYKLARGLKDLTEAMGAEVCEGQGVAGYRKLSAGGYQVTLESGQTLTCSKLILATNAYSYRFNVFKSGLVPIYTYIVATEPLSPKQWEQIGWDDRHGIESVFRMVHYMRPTKDGRILLGGKDANYYFGHKTQDRYDENQKLFSGLQQDLVKFFPSLKGIRFTHGWGGPVGSTLNFFPTMGREGDLIWALGCCGHGVSLFNYLGSIVSDLFFEKKTENTELFFVNKKPWALLPPEPAKFIGCGAYKETLKLLDRFDEIRTGKSF